ncbi:hypothetical protein [Vibrio casei]|uniref:hypothetical protein n=1 Tax=Vibrio casei TaxID=673372 RepID=UPI000B5C4E81|nr:hypothetical protein [Vibrio casei]
MSLRVLELSEDRCPVVMQKVMLATKSFKDSDDSFLLISTIEPTAERDITAMLGLPKMSGIHIHQQAIGSDENGVEQYQFLLTKTV